MPTCSVPIDLTFTELLYPIQSAANLDHVFRALEKSVVTRRRIPAWVVPRAWSTAKLRRMSPSLLSLRNEAPMVN